MVMCRTLNPSTKKKDLPNSSYELNLRGLFFGYVILNKHRTFIGPKGSSTRIKVEPKRLELSTSSLPAMRSPR